jgi:hypothetical protein
VVRQAGCRSAQGHLLATPMSAAEVTGYLKPEFFMEIDSLDDQPPSGGSSDEDRPNIRSFRSR